MFKPKSVNSAIAPLSRIVDDLRRIAKEQDESACDLHMRATALTLRCEGARTEASRAGLAASKIEALFTPTGEE